MIALTWLVPAGVFFTSIIGWQYFVGERTVPAERCYVQYMDNAVFNCILQVCTHARSLDAWLAALLASILHPRSSRCVRPRRQRSIAMIVSVCLILSHPPGGRLPLLSARPAVTSVAFTRWRQPYTRYSTHLIPDYYLFIDPEGTKG